MTTEAGVLLVNLGSPRSPAPRDVRRYLAEFLDDPRVIDLPMPVRRLVLYLFILPFRPRRSGEAYAQIWTDEGSPLVVISEAVGDALRERVDVPVEVAMRYGEPSIASGLAALRERGVGRVLLVPQYPHYAMSSYETVVALATEAAASMGLDLHVQPPFFDDPGYLDALAAKVAGVVSADHVLFSFHGIPERHVRKTDPSGCWCLEMDGCCDKRHPSQALCYRYQCIATARAVAARLELPADRWSVAYQSRLGPGWLTPFSDKVLEALPARGVKHLAVVCPSFVADCLETLEEMGIRGRASFLASGGDRFDLVPCLNTDPAWVEVLERFVRDWL